jgi:small subunit ribosomal protein S20
MSKRLQVVMRDAELRAYQRVAQGKGMVLSEWVRQSLRQSARGQPSPGKEKKNRQRIRRQARNSAQKAAMRTAVKNLRAAVAAKDKPQAAALLKSATTLISRLGGRGVIKKRNSSRSVSRLTVAVNALAK